MFSVVDEPYKFVAPYSTCESEFSFVVHVIIAEFDEGDEATEEIVGGVVSDVGPAAVVKLIVTGGEYL